MFLTLYLFSDFIIVFYCEFYPSKFFVGHLPYLEAHTGAREGDFALSHINTPKCKYVRVKNLQLSPQWGPSSRIGSLPRCFYMVKSTIEHDSNIRNCIQRQEYNFLSFLFFHPNIYVRVCRWNFPFLPSVWAHCSLFLCTFTFFSMSSVENFHTPSLTHSNKLSATLSLPPQIG